MMIGETPQVKLLAKVARWQPPPGVLRQIALDYDPRGLAVTLVSQGAYCTGIMLYGSTDAVVECQMKMLVFKLYVILDEANYSFDLGPFVLKEIAL